MNNCIIWGIGEDYDRIINQIIFEVHKGNIMVEALVCRKQDKYCDIKDGFPVVIKDELKKEEIDYVIIASVAYFNQIKEEAMQIGFLSNQIINGELFLMPLFDFPRYAQLLSNPVTILTNDCWGGIVYNRLGLPFTSPLINTFIDLEDYSELILNPLFYLNTELKMIKKGDLGKEIFPMGYLGDGNRRVQIKFVHEVDFDEAKKRWDRRKQRINPNNLFVKMGFSAFTPQKELYIDAFNKVQYNKVLFYTGDEQIKGAFKTGYFESINRSRNFVGTYRYDDFLRKQIELGLYYGFDLLKLLTGDEAYSRER